MTLPTEVIERDHNLASSSTLLMALRHFWTLDESNPARISLAEYGRQVGVAQRVISAYAHGYELMRDEKASTAQEAIERAHMSEETAAAVAAVAEIHGVSFGSASKYYRDDVRFVREEAREQAEELGTDYWTALPDAVEALRQKVAHRGEGSGSSHSQLYLKVNARLIIARDKIRSCVAELREAQFKGEEAEDVNARLEEVRDALDDLERTLAVADDVASAGVRLVS